MDRMYMSSTEIDVLKKLYIIADKVLTQEEKTTFDTIISLYSKPKIKKENLKEG